MNARDGFFRDVLVPPLRQMRTPALGGSVHALRGDTMGTDWCVKWIAAPGIDTQAVRRAIERELQIVIDQMSPWEPASTVRTFADAPACQWVPIPDALRTVLAAALQVARSSGGAYDPTAAPLIDLWGFGAAQRFDDATFTAPSERAIAQARRRCGWQRLRLGDDGAWQPGAVQLDLCAIAKGHAVDRIAERLADLGIEAMLIEVGGELRGHGVKHDGQPWWVALEQPPGCKLPPCVLAAHDIAVATSGDYRRCWRGSDGCLRSHTIDPRSGAPIAHDTASVTVVHPSCMWADAWSTALTVLGLTEGLALAQRLGLAAHFIVRGDGGVWHSAASAAWHDMAH